MPNESYGALNQDFWIGAPDFYPQNNVPWSHQSLMYWASSTVGSYVAIIHLPAGAHISELACDFSDTSPGANANVLILRNSVNDTTGTGGNQLLAFVISSALNGVGMVAVATDITVNYRTSTERVMYWLQANMPGDTAVRLRGCRLIWNRQVSPAPGTATFNDVPTTHPLFRFVEALVASGITGGCSASPPQYCPDAPLTRGQMAVFLSGALGLHWPY